VLFRLWYLCAQVAPGIAWSLWRPAIKALEPALAAKLVVSQYYQCPYGLKCFTSTPQLRKGGGAVEMISKDAAAFVRV
jgi:hypothetical protein